MRYTRQVERAGWTISIQTMAFIDIVNTMLESALFAYLFIGGKKLWWIRNWFFAVWFVYLFVDIFCCVWLNWDKAEIECVCVCTRQSVYILDLLMSIVNCMMISGLLIYFCVIAVSLAYVIAVHTFAFTCSFERNLKQ